MAKFRKMFENAYEKALEDNPDVVRPEPKWDVVLFAGDYDPITKDEYSRVRQFVNNYVKGMYRDKFSESVDLALITNYQDTVENDLLSDDSHNLSFDERQFLTTKLFGLKLFPVDFNSIFELSSTHVSDEEEPKITQSVSEMIELFKENFYDSNVLIVVRPQDISNTEAFMQMSPMISDNINIGVLAWEHQPEKFSERLKKIPMIGQTIKAITLLDHERPNPESLHNFAYKYRLQDMIEELRRIHFITANENYVNAFRMAFPDVFVLEGKDETIEWNHKIVMELLKQMYLKQDQG